VGVDDLHRQTRSRSQKPSRSLRGFLRVRVSWKKRFVVPVAGLVSMLSEQIDIRALDKLGRFDAQLDHERLRFLNTNLDRLIFFQDNLKLQEMAEAFESRCTGVLPTT
jgi:hypothetical protein